MEGHICREAPSDYNASILMISFGPYASAASNGDQRQFFALDQLPLMRHLFTRLQPTWATPSY